LQAACHRLKGSSECIEKDEAGSSQMLGRPLQYSGVGEVGVGPKPLT